MNSGTGAQQQAITLLSTQLLGVGSAVHEVKLSAPNSSTAQAEEDEGMWDDEEGEGDGEGEEGSEEGGSDGEGEGEGSEDEGEGVEDGPNGDEQQGADGDMDMAEPQAADAADNAAPDAAAVAAAAPPHPVTQYLCTLATTFTHITTLTLQPLRGALPPPPTFPALKHLTVLLNRRPSAQLMHSLGQYWCTVTSLTLNFGSRAFTLAAPVLSRLIVLLEADQARSQTLKSFSTDSGLNVPVVVLVQQFGPAVESLSVASLYALPELLSSMEWGVRELYIEEGLQHSKEAEALALLPKSTGPLTIHAPSLSLCVDTPQGLPAHVLERLPTWHFPHTTVLHLIQMPGNMGVPADQQPQCATNVLAQLQPYLQPADAGSGGPLQLAVQFDSWALTEGFIAALNAATHTLAPRTLGFTVRGDLTSPFLGRLLHLQGSFNQVLVRGAIALDSTEHAGAVLRAHVAVHELSARQLLRLPRGVAKPQCGPDRLIVACHGFDIDITPEEVSAGLVDTLCARMGTFSFQPLFIGAMITLTCPPNLPPAEQPALMRAQLRVLAAMQWLRRAGNPPTVRVLAVGYAPEVQEVADPYLKSLAQANDTTGTPANTWRAQYDFDSTVLSAHRELQAAMAEQAAANQALAEAEAAVQQAEATVQAAEAELAAANARLAELEAAEAAAQGLVEQAGGATSGSEEA